jgi:hypothetical protein
MADKRIDANFADFRQFNSPPKFLDMIWECPVIAQSLPPALAFYAIMKCEK